MNIMTLLRRAQFHGASRLAEPRHRVYWAVALLLLLWLALSVLSEMIMRFLQAPTHLITMATITNKLAFPSVVVCPEILFPQWKIEMFLADAIYPKGMSADSIRPIIRQLTAFYSPDVVYNLYDLVKVQHFLEYNDLDVEEAGTLLTTTCEETFIRCRFLRQDVDCSDLFQMEITPYGFCCVFNGRSLRRDMEQRNNRSNYKSKEWYTTETGVLGSLMIVINQSQELGSVDLSYKWLIVQSSQLYVEVTKNGTPLSPGTEHWTRFWTRPLYVREDLNFLSDKLRGCQMGNNPLKLFPSNQRKYCIVECTMKQIIRQCQCLPPTTYRPPGVPLCHPLSLSCARQISGTDRSNCDCPHTCEYESEITDGRTFLFAKNTKPIDPIYEGLDLEKVTVTRVYIKGHVRMSSIRQSYFSFYDLFAQLGGVFNVFFGCSMLTLLELLQLVWHSFRRPAARVTPKGLLAVPTLTKKVIKRNKKSPFFNLCCRRRGRVEKARVTKKKVSFTKLKTLDDLRLFLNWQY